MTRLSDDFLSIDDICRIIDNTRISQLAFIYLLIIINVSFLDREKREGEESCCWPLRERLGDASINNSEEKEEEVPARRCWMSIVVMATRKGKEEGGGFLHQERERAPLSPLSLLR